VTTRERSEAKNTTAPAISSEVGMWHYISHLKWSWTANQGSLTKAYLGVSPRLLRIKT